MNIRNVDDGRPAGWTEAKCLEFIALHMRDDHDVLALMFTRGEWGDIKRFFPEFVKWMKEWN